MRLVGKRSVASILRWLLGAANVVVTFGIVVMTMWLVLRLIAPDAMVRSGFDEGMEDPGLDMARMWVTALLIPRLAFVWLVFNRLRRILASVNAGDAFEATNVGRLQAIGVGLIGWQLANHVEAVARPFVEGRAWEAHINIDAWLAILVVFILAEVFRQGAQMRDDAQMTV